MAKSFSFGNYEVKKFFKGLCIAFAGALATYMQDAIPGIDFGTWMPIVMMLNSIVVNALQLWVSDNQFK